ncbi:MAG: glycosyl hydrolase, partial [Candidatus Latescibacteria bacterium]|nr:glycosyl hydrolase [Candidatus Latescibacterota bacterium]
MSDSDSNVIYAGMGEACIRGNVSHGDGVYKSTDKGLTWEHVGLEDTRHIARIQIHPKNPDIVYVAAFGNAFGQNPERGIYRSKDGGQSWELILFKSNKAGAIDLSIDPNNPRVIYAATYEALRKPWHFSSGGPDSGIYKSIDGGENWDEINHNHGIPIGIKGRIGIAISPANPNRVWAVIESKDEGGIYRSDDDGKSWHKISDDKNVQARSWYFNHIFADPKDPNTLYVLSLKMWKSTDGGKTFVEIPTPHGDQHGLWIDPNNPLRMIEGNDGGACVSFNGGESWSSTYNQPTAQFYRMSADNQFPYRVYATQQDNTAISVPSRSSKSSILWSDCYIVGNSESGQIAVKPNNPDIVYSGAIGSTAGGGDMLLRYDHSNNQIRDVSVWPEVFWEGVKGHKYRFQWTYPIVISDHDPNTIYVAANVIFRSVNDGNSWEIMSKDLTRCDVTKMEDSGGPINLDMTYVEHFGTVFALAESVFEADTLWVGSDDGLVHITRDLGKNWENITPEELPEWTLISMIEPSKHNPATAYLAGTRYKLNDLQPYLYKTND